MRAVCTAALIMLAPSCVTRPAPHYPPGSIIARICSYLPEMDRRHDGKVDFEEYSNYLDAHGLQDFNPLFGVIDHDRKGYIDAGDCAHAVAEESYRRVYVPPPD